MDKGRRIGVLMGGMSTERNVSLKSGHAVYGALKERGWDAVEIDVGRDLPQRLLAEKVDVAWLALHGKFGEDGCVQGLLEVMGIPYTGSGVRASAVAMDKIATKRAVVGAESVVMAPDKVVHRGDPLPVELGLPLVVKPSVGGSTIGISIVKTEAELAAAVTAALALCPEVLVEKYIAGEEITVAVVDGKALPVIRIVPDSGFFDYAAKYQKGLTNYECPAQIAEASAIAAQRAAEAAYRRVGCRGLARADFMVGQDGVPVFLEINTLPGMTATSLSPMAASVVGVSFGELVEKILLGAQVEAVEAAAPL